MQSNSGSSTKVQSNSINSNNSGSMESQTEFRVYLRGVDLVDLAERYLNGEFAELSDPIPIDPSSIKDLSNRSENLVTIRETGKDKSYQLDLGAGQKFACIGYKVYDKSGRYGIIDPKAIVTFYCMRCLIPGNDLSKAIGIPVRREIRSVKTAQNEYLDIFYYHCIDIFCGFRCAYGELIKRKSNQLYAHSFNLLSEIYFIWTGKDFSKVRPSSDPRLLKVFNGHMDWDEYHDENTNYPERPGNIVFIPAIEYIEEDPQSRS